MLDLTRAGDKSPSSSFISVFLLPSLPPSTAASLDGRCPHDFAASPLRHPDDDDGVEVLSKEKLLYLSLSLSLRPLKLATAEEEEREGLTRGEGSHERAAGRASKLDIFNGELCYPFSRQDQCWFGIEMFNGPSPLKPKGDWEKTEKDPLRGKEAAGTVPFWVDLCGTFHFLDTQTFFEPGKGCPPGNP